MTTQDHPDYLSRNWNPNSIFICTMKQIKRWFLNNGRCGFYNGERYTLKYTKLCPGVYEVKFEASN